MVVDASAILRAITSHEEGSAEALDVLARLVTTGEEIVAPDIFPYEVGHSLTRGKGTREERIALLARALGIATVRRPTAEERREALELALDQRLSYYDTSYVIAARAEDAALWTEDRQLLAKFPEIAESTATLLARYAP